MLIKCPECNNEVSDKAVFCPKCGYPINSTVVTKKSHIEANTKPQTYPRTRKKHKKLPNGYGSIKFLGKNRSKPYAAYPPTTEYNNNGSPVTQKAIGYFETWYSAFDALRLYNENPYNLADANLTFSDIFVMYYKDKYENSKKKYSNQTKTSSKAAYKNCKALHNIRFKDLRKIDLQKVIDCCKLKHSSLELIVSLFHGMYKFAMANDFVDKDYSQFVTINIPDDDEQGEPFYENEISLLWENRNIPEVQGILIMIYSGFRVSAYHSLQINTEAGYFQGGVKNKYSKDRMVPIHSAIFDFVNKSNELFKYSSNYYRLNIFTPTLKKLGILFSESGKKHTPHDCRHTFSWLCDKYKVDDVSKHLMMGHKLTGDIEKSVYSHRTLDELKSEIEKIKVIF